MSLLLAIDPGVVLPGAAVFDLGTKRLVSARYFRGPGFKNDLGGVVAFAYEVAKWAGHARGTAIGSVVVEWPQVYGGGRSGGRKDPNDLLPLAAFNGAVASFAALFASANTDGQCVVGVRHHTPHEWKGSKKKNPTARMVIDRLNEGDETPKVEEIAEFIAALEKCAEIGRRTGKEPECKHPTMNALDAVGVGLFHLGRLTRRRVIAR